MIPISRTSLRPYRVFSIEPFTPATPRDRLRAAEAAGWNVAGLDPSTIDLDLRSDSASSSRLTSQLAAVQAGACAAEDPAGHEAVVEEIRSLTGKRHVVLFAQGRAAEAALADALPLPGSLVAANCIFPSTRHHLERRGADVLECPRAGLFDVDSDEPFKGEPDLEQMLTALKTPGRPTSIWIELASNGAFGQPVSLACLERIGEVAGHLGSRLYLDATRCLENAVLLERREPAAQLREIREIVRTAMRAAHAIAASCLKSFHSQSGGFVATDDEDLARALEDASIARGDGMAGPALEVLRQGIRFAAADAVAIDRARQASLLHRLLKREGLPVIRPEAAHAVFLDARQFLPEVPPEGNPAKALALALYLQSGIRVDEHMLPASLASRGSSAVRIAVPARRYFDDQIQWVAEELETLHQQRTSATGLRRLASAPGLAGLLRPRFELMPQGVTA